MGALELQDCMDCIAFLLEQKYNRLSICTFHLCIVFSLFCVFRKSYALQTAGLVFSVEWKPSGEFNWISSKFLVTSFFPVSWHLVRWRWESELKFRELPVCWFMTWNFRNNLGLLKVAEVIEISKWYIMSPISILPEQMPAISCFFFPNILWILGIVGAAS